MDQKIVLVLVSIVTVVPAEDALDLGTYFSKLYAIRGILNGFEHGEPCTDCDDIPDFGRFNDETKYNPENETSLNLRLDELSERMDMVEEIAKKVSKFPGFCYAGLSTSVIPVSALSAAATHSACPIKDGILNSAGGWCALRNDHNQWLMVDFGYPHTITGVLTQGRKNTDQWVTTFKISYGNDTSAMTYYEDRGSVKVFAGNTDRDTIVKNEFAHPITARYFRLHPMGYRSHMSMRLEYLEC